MIASACGKQEVHHLEREDLAALSIEAAAMAGVPLAGTSWIPGQRLVSRLVLTRNGNLTQGMMYGARS